MKINKDTGFKIVGVVATGLSVAASLLLSWHGEKNMKRTVAEEVTKAISNQAKES